MTLPVSKTCPTCFSSDYAKVARKTLSFRLTQDRICTNCGTQYTPQYVAPSRKSIFITMLIVSGVVITVAAIVLVGAMISIRNHDREDLRKAEEITRKTFREKIGSEPDSITFEGIVPTQPRTRNVLHDTEEVWIRKGVARVGDKVFDVKISRLEKELTHTAWLVCELTPRD